jgi:hypothetical protein
MVVIVSRSRSDEWNFIKVLIDGDKGDRAAERNHGFVDLNVGSV